MISSSRMRTTIGSPPSRQGASMRTSCPGNSQRTASDSKPHWPYHFCSPSTLILYCVGRLENGANEWM